VFGSKGAASLQFDDQLVAYEKIGCPLWDGRRRAFGLPRSFPVVCSMQGYGSYPFFVDYADGKRSLAGVCFYRLRTAAFHLATSRSRTGRP